MSIMGAAGEVADDWVDATTAALADELGADAASALMAALRPVIPAGYDELNWPNGAVIDLPIVHRLATADGDGCARVATAMMHFEEADGANWRFRVYHCGAALAIADLLPMLDHLGFRAIDERSSRFVFP